MKCTAQSSAKSFFVFIVGCILAEFFWDWEHLPTFTRLLPFIERSAVLTNVTYIKRQLPSSFPSSRPTIDYLASQLVLQDLPSSKDSSLFSEGDDNEKKIVDSSQPVIENPAVNQEPDIRDETSQQGSNLWWTNSRISECLNLESTPNFERDVESVFKEFQRIQQILRPFRKENCVWPDRHGNKFLRIEGRWVDAFAFRDYTAATFQETFGNFIPLFVNWMGLYKLENFHSNDLVNKHVAKFRGYKMRNYTEFIQAVNVIKNALNPKFAYFTVSNHDLGAFAAFDFYRNTPNMLVFSAGGYGHVPIPLLSNSEIPYIPLDKNSTANMISFVGAMHKNRELFIRMYKSASRKFQSTVTIHPIESSSTDFAPIHAGYRYVLAARGYGRTAYHLSESLLISRIPIFTFADEDIPWVPYINSGFWKFFGDAADRVKNDVLCLPEAEGENCKENALTDTPFVFVIEEKKQEHMDLLVKFIRDLSWEDYEKMQKSLVKHRKFFEYDFVVDQIQKFLVGGSRDSNLRCLKLPDHENGHRLDSDYVDCCNFKCVGSTWENHYYGVLHGCPPTNSSGCVDAGCLWEESKTKAGKWDPVLSPQSFKYPP